MSLIQRLIPVQRIGHPTIKHTWKIQWEDAPSETVTHTGWKMLVTREFLREIKEGEIIPKWYGFAYFDWDTDAKYFLPLPLNWIVGAYRALRIFVKFRLSEVLTFRPMQLAYHLGRRDERLKRSTDPRFASK